MELLRTVKADLRALVHSNYGSGPGFWLRVAAKALTSPAAHVVVLVRISQLLYRWLPTRPLAFVLRGLTVVWGGTEIHPGTTIGPGLHLVHSQKVIIGPGRHDRPQRPDRPGRDDRRRQGAAGARVAPGHPGARRRRHDRARRSSPRTGDDRRRCRRGAKSLVLHDVPAGAVVRGTPATVVRYVVTAAGSDGPDAGSPASASGS